MAARVGDGRVAIATFAVYGTARALRADVASHPTQAANADSKRPPGHHGDPVKAKLHCPIDGCDVHTTGRQQLLTHLASPNGHNLGKTAARELLDGNTLQSARRIGHHDVLGFAAPGEPYGRLMAEVFRTLIGWRRYPGYRFEQRVDGFVLFFLAGLLREWGWAGVRVVAPEWPVGNARERADALLWRGGPTPAWVLLEIKTDSLSATRDQKQWNDRVEYAKGHRTMKSMLRWLKGLVDENQGKSGMEQRYRLYLDAVLESGCSLDDPVEAALLMPGDTSGFKKKGATAISFDELLGLRLPEHGIAWELFRDSVIRALVEEPAARRAGMAMLRGSP